MVRRGLLISLWCLVIGWPVLALAVMGVESSEARADAGLRATGPPVWPPVWTTVRWSIGMALLAVVAAIPAARLLAGVGRRLRGVLLGIACSGLLLPPWALYYLWWSSMPPGSVLHDLAAGSNRLAVLRGGLAAAAVLASVWPIAVCCITPASMRWSGQHEDELRLDGVGRVGRSLRRLRCEAPGLAAAAIVVAVLTAGCTTVFDLAGVATLANELRARSDLGGSGLAVLGVAWPLVPAALLGAAAAWWWAARPPMQAERRRGVSAGPAVVSAAIWLVVVGLPLALLVSLSWRVEPAAGGSAWHLVEGVARTVGRGLIVGAMAAVLAVATRDLWSRWVWSLLACSWVAAALLPSPLVGAVVAEAWPGAVAATGGTWVLALLVRGGAIGLLASRWLARTEPTTRRDLRRLDGWVDLVSDPVTRTAGAAALLIALAISAGDIVLAGRLAPPMASPPIAVTLLNAIHYQRPETVVAVLLLLPAPMLLLLPVLMRHTARRAAPLVLCGAVIGLFGCGSVEDEPIAALPIEGWSGLPGRTPGRFDVPRGITIDANGDVYIVDKSARVQRLDGEGAALCWWTMPASDNGKPAGLTALDGGVIAVADTHEYRVAIFDRCGALKRTFGGYGMEPGAMVYPTDVAVSPEGEWFVAEYGGNDRVQVFDERGRVQRVLGGPGRGPGAFRRPQSLAIDGDVMWVADSGNHRVQGLDLQTGLMVAEIGVGVLRSPWAVAVGPDGSLLVVDQGTHTLTRWAKDGEHLGTWGGWGRAPGRLRMPWGVAIDPSGSTVHVLDTGNARVQRVPWRALLMGPQQ